MTALDRQLVRIRFAALALPFGLLLWLPCASVPVTIILAGLTFTATLAAPETAHRTLAR